MNVTTPESRANDEAFTVVAKDYGYDWTNWGNVPWWLYYDVYKRCMQESRAAIAEHRDGEGDRI